ncbi:hypothetical protein PoB_000332400 [Plakobranchus ocellatus]|uniref:Helitron helicase-like domain-containing protein n=1 Tax=Plakobranchus ocellatus TaxID=259542 RepID=A0AAV3Y3L6_9GAST|nr:hypothetical protein PoB_000332400 [Plakobranchus ocellatus]
MRPCFQSEPITDKVDGANRIYDTLKNRGTKHMLLFLQYIFQKVTKLNLEFQSKHFRQQLLHNMMTEKYKTFNTTIQDIDPSQESLHQDIGDIYLGGKATALLLSEPFDNDACKTGFKNDCN